MFSTNEERELEAVIAIDRLGKLLYEIDSKAGLATRLAFVAECCAVNIGNYAEFQRSTGWGRVDVLKKTLDVICKFVESRPKIDAQLLAKTTALLADVEAVAPDSEFKRQGQVGTLTANEAQDVCVLFSEAIDLVSTRGNWQVGSSSDRSLRIVRQFEVRRLIQRFVDIEAQLRGDAWTRSFWTSEEYVKMVDDFTKEAWKISAYMREMERQIISAEKFMTLRDGNTLSKSITKPMWSTLGFANI